MGAFCSCFRVPDEQANTGSNNSSSECFLQKFINKHGNPFTRRQRQHISSPNQQASSLISGLVFLSNSSDANGPHDGAFGNIGSFRQYNGARGRQENGTRRSQVQPQPVEKSDVRVNPKSRQGDKMGPQEQRSESSAKVLSSGVDGIAYTFPSPGDEDECPTCLEEYTQENPKIIAKCSHHYHLSCIYEWMERSENCPACRKLMQFDESS